MTCKDCIHYDVCSKKHWHVESNKYTCDLNDVEKSCFYFKNKSRIIELPCKVGDIVYRIQYVDNTNILLRGIGIKEYVFNLSFYGLNMSEFGKTIFLTKEQAEAKLKELNENG